MKTRKEIKDQIELLKLQRKGIPHHSGFGDDNWASIDMQVRVLELALEQDEMEIEVALEDAEDQARRDALDWVLGNTDEDLVEPSDPWVKKAREAKV